MTEKEITAYQWNQFKTKPLGNFFYEETNRDGRIWHVCATSISGGGNDLLEYKGTQYCRECGESLRKTEYSDFIKISVQLGVELKKSNY